MADRLAKIRYISQGWIRQRGRVSRFETAKYLLENEPVISGHIIIEINDSQCTCLAFEMDTRWHAVWLSQTRFIDSPSDICFSAASLASFSNGCVITNGHLLTIVIRRSTSSYSVCCYSPISAFSKETSTLGYRLISIYSSRFYCARCSEISKISFHWYKVIFQLFLHICLLSGFCTICRRTSLIFLAYWPYFIIIIVKVS